MSERNISGTAPAGAAALAALAKARALLEAYGPQLAADADQARLLSEYFQEILRSHGLMRSKLAFDACAVCAGQDGGASCCFEGAEDWYYPLLLLANLSLGMEPPVTRSHPQDCLFNGDLGCGLLARYGICLNFFCPELFARLGEAEMLGLRRAVGRELEAGRLWEECVGRWLVAHGERGWL
ncbi:MAG: hypothetical protein KMY53_10570 [Desulfarculus sp.]|nr:hypothetical protein [Pseudomonadota bacterium]MBV1715871.1 hypothetical protein [Desulfarculus sp.]MBU4575391.1 hypothetical protein [Pseudomonadota bacterium]MBU4600224.1 hypothetical protein [Pseudomonadota bacterium]MBV1738597.1 hypothetical protein [Desulfarculus sp.]